MIRKEQSKWVTRPIREPKLVRPNSAGPRRIWFFIQKLPLICIIRIWRKQYDNESTGNSVTIDNRTLSEVANDERFLLSIHLLFLTFFFFIRLIFEILGRFKLKGLGSMFCMGSSVEISMGRMADIYKIKFETFNKVWRFSDSFVSSKNFCLLFFFSFLLLATLSFIFCFH